MCLRDTHRNRDITRDRMRGEGKRGLRPKLFDILAGQSLVFDLGSLTRVCDFHFRRGKTMRAVFGLGQQLGSRQIKETDR